MSYMSTFDEGLVHHLRTTNCSKFTALVNMLGLSIADDNFCAVETVPSGQLPTYSTTALVSPLSLAIQDTRRLYECEFL